jgi:large subunit ribosomal protein L9
MKVILLKSVPKVGHKYDVVDVAEGFAMNSLFPKGLAENASAKAVARVAALKATEDAERKIREDLLLKNLTSLESVKIEVSGKANDKGHLFGGIHKDEIIVALKEQAHVDITAEYIVLDKPIKEVGDHKVEVNVQGKTAEFTVSVSAN